MSDIAVITIGRNEGDRLKRCIASVRAAAQPVIYVDSGSTDGSVAFARAAGIEVVELDLSIPFTAARARNAGLARLRELNPGGTYVQFLDGDCELVAGWLPTAIAEIEADPALAVVCGRRREKFPDATIWNKMIDSEWDSPPGEAESCGGDALMRRAALDEVAGYRSSMIAGEEPEMCYRLRARGWRVRRIDAEMTLHDAAISRIGQWWKRCRRAGYAYAEGAFLHGRGAERFRVRETLRALFWGVAIPALALAGAVLIHPLALAILLVWPLQILRLSLKGFPLSEAVFLTAGKLPESQGVIDYLWGRLIRRRRGLIEYK